MIYVDPQFWESKTLSADEYFKNAKKYKSEGWQFTGMYPQTKVVTLRKPRQAWKDYVAQKKKYYSNKRIEEKNKQISESIKQVKKVKDLDPNHNWWDTKLE